MFGRLFYADHNSYICTSSCLTAAFTAHLLIYLFLFFPLSLSPFICRTDGTESPIITESDADTDKPRVRYGELVILG